LEKKWRFVYFNVNNFATFLLLDSSQESEK